MTTYSYTITFDDSEIIMLEAALKLFKDHCQKKLDNNEGAPYWAHKQSVISVQAKLHSNTQQMSGNNFNT